MQNQPEPAAVQAEVTGRNQCGRKLLPSHPSHNLHLWMTFSSSPPR